MTYGEERANSPTILTLPDDVLYAILDYCTVTCLCRFAATCRRMKRLVSHDSVWKRHLRQRTLVQSYHTDERLPGKERCRLAKNWKNGIATEYRIIHHRVKLMPWIQMQEDLFWISYKNIVRCYQQKPSGRLAEIPSRYLRGGAGDVGKFCAKQGLLVAGFGDGSVSAFRTASGELTWCKPAAHSSHVHSTDFHNDTVVTGSRDCKVKVWNMHAGCVDEALQYQIDIGDRVWSVAVNPTGESFVVGSAGLRHSSPLQLFHTESGEQLCRLGSEYRHGAGVLDIQYESPHLMFTCGYDTIIRLWDFRQSSSQPVCWWEEPFDSTVYCVRWDGRHALLAGTARHGMVRLWDTRATRSVQIYYCGRISSPVYSLAYDARHLYVALDKGINMLDFKYSDVI